MRLIHHQLPYWCLLLVLLVILPASSSAEAPQPLENYQLPSGTTSMLFQLYLQPEETAYPGSFAFAVERRIFEKVGIRAGMSFQGCNLTRQSRSESLENGVYEQEDNNHFYYSIGMSSLLVYHFKPSGVLQGSLAIGPRIDKSAMDSDDEEKDLRYPSRTLIRTYDLTGWSINGDLILDLQWRLLDHLSLTGSCGYEISRVFYDYNQRNTFAGVENPPENRYKSVDDRWFHGTTGASLGLMYHFQGKPRQR